jgi:trigger factor
MTNYTVTPEQKGSMEILLKIVFDDEYTKTYDKKAKNKLAKTLKVPGFRAGKIPDKIVMEHLNPMKIRMEAIELMIDKHHHDFFADIKQKVLKVNPLDLKEFFPASLEISCITLPDIKLEKWQKDVGTKIDLPKIGKKEKDTALEEIQKQHITYAKTSEKIAKDHRVIFDFAGYWPKDSKDGTPEESIPGTDVKSHTTVIGQGNFIPGFEDALIGMKEKEEKSSILTFPKDYHHAPLAGKKVEFRFLIHTVEESKLPDIDEEFIKKIIGKKGSDKDLDSFMEKQLLQKAWGEKRVEAEKTALENLIKKKYITLKDIPQNFIETSQKNAESFYQKKIQEHNMTFEAYLKHEKKTKSQYDDMVKEMAEKNILEEVLMLSLLDHEKIEISSKEVEMAVIQRMMFYPPNMQQQAKDFYDSQEGKEQMARDLQIKKLFDLAFPPMEK